MLSLAVYLQAGGAGVGAGGKHSTGASTRLQETTETLTKAQSTNAG